MRIIQALLFALALALLLAPLHARAQAPAKPDILEVLEISGVIGPWTATTTTAKVEEINANPKIKAVLVVLDTPGGGLTSSDVVREELAKIKAPVMVWCQTVCASGGVWVSMASSVKFIAVRPQTVGGSVGVIATITRFNRLLEWLKIDNETYRTGALKDAGNPTRAAEELEKKYIQGIMDAGAAAFYANIEKARGEKVPASAWPAIKSASIFVGPELVKVGLADAVMTKEQAHAKAKELSGSKVIFTRDELRKMAKQADDFPHASGPLIEPHARPTTPPLGDLPALVEMLKELRQGETVKFEVRLPYQF